MGLVRGEGDRRSSAGVVPCSDAKTLVPSSLNVQKRNDVGRKRSETETFQSVVSRSITSLNVSIEEEDELRTLDPPSLSGILSKDWQRATSLLEGAASLIAPTSLARFPRVGWTPVHSQSLWCCEPFRPSFFFSVRTSARCERHNGSGVARLVGK